MKNILLAVDLKSTDTALMQHALMLAEKFSSTVWIVHVAAPDPDFIGYGVGPVYIRDVRADELRNEHKQLQAMANHLKEKSVVAEALLIQGPTIEMLKEEVSKLSVDLIIMGSHKHGLLYDMWIGHTEVKVIREIQIPTLIIPITYGE